VVKAKAAKAKAKAASPFGEWFWTSLAYRSPLYALKTSIKANDMKPNRFRNCVIDANLPQAIKIAEGLLSAGSNMIEEISNKTDFKYDSGSGIQVAMKLLSGKDPINVYTYRPFRKSSKVIGYFQNGAIHINIYVLEKFDLKLIVGNLLHEYAHSCGFHHNSAFRTSNFKTEHKVKHSVPYFLSENVEKWI